MIPTLQTDRLTLRPLTSDDALDLFAIYGDNQTMQFMPSRPHETVEQTRQMIEYHIGLQDSQHWVICLKDQSKAIGHIYYLGQVRVPGMGYILHRDYWGQGIVPETCEVLLDHGFTILNCDRVELWIDETNTASQRVAQKLGFKPKARFAHKYNHETHPHFVLVWGILAQEWRGEPISRVKETTQFHSIDPVLTVHDIEATVEFYRAKFGFTVDFLYGTPPVHAGVSRGEWTGNMVSIQFSYVPPEHDIKSSAYLRIDVSHQIDKLFQ